LGNIYGGGRFGTWVQFPWVEDLYTHNVRFLRSQI
jgi:hypothetical protein